MSTQDIVRKVATELNLPYNYVWEVYSAYWKAVRAYISSVDLKKDITKEEFSKLRLSINIPSLGKFHVDWNKLKAKKDSYEGFSNKSIKTTILNSNNN